jgi:hypothetical protein
MAAFAYSFSLLLNQVSKAIYNTQLRMIFWKSVAFLYTSNEQSEKEIGK